MTEERIINCKKCFKVIGRTAFENQVLILENGLTAFNYLCWLCPHCKKSYDSWLAPDLSDGEQSNAEKYPDAQTIERRAGQIRKSFKQSQPKPPKPEKPPKVIKPKREVKGYHFDSAKNKFRAVITIKNKPIYLGIFDNETDAHNAYLAAKNMHNLKQDIPDNHADHESH